MFQGPARTSKDSPRSDGSNLRAVLPPLVGGLHCGGTGKRAAIVKAKVLPPLVGGLHCGLTVDDMTIVETLCSRRWSAGSIAAPFTTAPRSAPTTRCSRRWSAGSIAAQWAARGEEKLEAVLPPLVGGLHCGNIVNGILYLPVPGAPAAGRRAPLRPRCQSALQPHGSLCSRRWSAGSIAARTTTSPATSWRPVLPPLVGGLHCGHEVRRVGQRLTRRAPAAGRRAPLRPR